MGKILVVTTFMPYPLDMGSKINLYRVLQIMSESHEVDLVAFTDDRENLKYVDELEKLCGRVKVFVKPEISTRYGPVWGRVFASLFSLKPFYVLRYFSKEVREFIRELIEKEGYDYVLIDHLKQAQYLPKKKKGRWVLKEYDIDHLVRWRAFLQERNLVRKVFYFIEAVKFYFYERKMVPRFDRWMAISERDKERLVELGAERERVVVERMWVRGRRRFEFREEEKQILFVGLLSWWPNREGVRWFLREVFPLIKEEVPGARVVIVGDQKKYVEKEVGEIEGVELTGYVEEVESYYEKASVFVAPLRVESGVRVKILNAMSSGVPVVSTSLGLEGIPVEKGRDVLVADDPDRFAEKVVKVMKEKSLAERLSGRAEEFVGREYSKEKARESFERLLQG